MSGNNWLKWLTAISGMFAAMGVANAGQPINMPVGVTDISSDVYDMHMIGFWLCVWIAVVVFGIMFYSIFAHRKSKGYTPATFHESTTVEAIWTTIPFIILIALAIPATKTLVAMEDTSDYDLTVKITGYQWLWHYEYIDEGVDFYSALKTPRDQINGQAPKGENYLLEVDKELVLPVGKKVRFLITANDVNHAWWVPDLAVTAGTYRGQCAELCGRDHGFMPIVVRAVEQAEFDQFLADNTTLTSDGAEYAAADQ
jgi:cytochrome c oxidase subunit 2